jgi:hypothetical protein
MARKEAAAEQEALEKARQELVTTIAADPEKFGAAQATNNNQQYNLLTGPFKSTIVNLFKYIEVIESGKVKFGGSVDSKKRKDLSLKTWYKFDVGEAYKKASLSSIKYHEP